MSTQERGLSVSSCSPSSLSRMSLRARKARRLLIVTYFLAAGRKLLSLFVLLCLLPSVCVAQPLGPDDPFAAVDGNPIYVGEINIILSQRLKPTEVAHAGIEIRQATALLLVRRKLAMKSLEQEGGDTLEAMISKDVEAYAVEARRRGVSLSDLASAQGGNEASLVSDLRWRAAWSRYLKSRLSDANLRRFYDGHRDQYAGGRYEVSQIFIEMDSKDVDSVRSATQEINALATQIGESGSPANAFAEIAVMHSESGSASQGGNVGWVEKNGDLPTSVMEAVRKTPVGSISKPIRSPLGMHLILVKQFEPSDRKFEELTDLAPLRRGATDALFDTLVMKQKTAKVVWFDSSLQRPDVNVFPQRSEQP